MKARKDGPGPLSEIFRPCQEADDRRTIPCVNNVGRSTGSSDFSKVAEIRDERTRAPINREITVSASATRSKTGSGASFHPRRAGGRRIGS